MRMCNHPNVLSCHCCFTHGPELWLVVPYMEYGASALAAAARAAPVRLTGAARPLPTGSCLRILRHLQRKGRIAEGEGFSVRLAAARRAAAAAGPHATGPPVPRQTGGRDWVCPCTDLARPAVPAQGGLDPPVRPPLPGERATQPHRHCPRAAATSRPATCWFRPRARSRLLISASRA